VAALTSGTSAGRRLEKLLAAGPPAAESDVELATALIIEAGGVAWAAAEADARLTKALAHLESAPLQAESLSELVALARYVVDRDH
jgi:geranylgeranyl diphosphate synthase, type I